MLHSRGFEAGLTPRELEVLELVANGYSAKEAASVLDIAPRTIERHIENVRLKVRARNRAHMVTQAIILGALNVGVAPIQPRLCSECLFQPSLEHDPSDPDHPILIEWNGKTVSGSSES